MDVININIYSSFNLCYNIDEKTKEYNTCEFFTLFLNEKKKHIICI